MTTAQNPTALGLELVQRGMPCNRCFEALPLQRADVAFPVPFAVGKRYRPGGVAMLGINPGASTAGAYKARRKEALAAFAMDMHSPAIETLWEGMSDDADNHWHPRYLNRLRALKLDPGSLLVGNLALCATAGDRYLRRMLNTCWEHHTAEMLRRHQPGILIFMGAERLMNTFMQKASAAMPHAQMLHIAHYAHRRGGEFEARECQRIREALASRPQP